MNILSVASVLFFTAVAVLSTKIGREMMQADNPIFLITAIMMAGVFIIAVVIILLIIHGESENQEN